MGQDDKVMPLIDMANIACGFHASDPDIMVRTVGLALQHDVMIGAHPSYHDIQGFGRRSIPHSATQIHALIWYQLGALAAICQAHGTQLSYVKPHGALNNDMMRHSEILEAVMDAVVQYQPGLPLMLPVTRDYKAHQALALSRELPLLMEAFADRAYDDRGRLVPRSVAGAVLSDPKAVIAQALNFAQLGGVNSINGEWLELPADSLCVHGDNEAALEAVKGIRQALSA